MSEISENVLTELYMRAQSQRRSDWVKNAHAILAASAGQAEMQVCAECDRQFKTGASAFENVAAPTPAAAQTIGGSHESAGTKPIGAVTVSTMEQDERGALSEDSIKQVAQRYGYKYEDRIVFYGDKFTEFAEALVEHYSYPRAAASPVSGAVRDVLAEAARKGWEAAMQFDTGEDGMEVAAYDNARDREINRIVAEIDRGERAGGKA